ncbi:MAG TPA: M23 family metallopeptidase [Gemmatimonadaceae bacterium]|nr:M23 family metallopeptidase [Gemmatimonadaceae bacterium]
MSSRKARRRVWTVVLVPPRPDARTHQLTVRARTVIALGTFTLALVAGAATWTEETSSIAATTADRLAESQRTVITLLDSVHVLGDLLASERAKRLPPRNMMMPVSGRISSNYARSRMHPVLRIFRPHRGVDIAAPAGTRIVAPAAGRVRFVGRRPGHGLIVELAHTGGVVTRYGHCRSALVKVGDEVAMGEPIATVGSSGLTTGPHLHFEVLTRGTSVDPIKFLAASREVTDVESSPVDTR